MLIWIDSLLFVSLGHDEAQMLLFKRFLLIQQLLVCAFRRASRRLDGYHQASLMRFDDQPRFPTIRKRIRHSALYGACCWRSKEMQFSGCYELIITLDLLWMDMLAFLLHHRRLVVRLT